MRPYTQPSISLFSDLHQTQPDLEMAAALAFARRRRLGPFRTTASRAEHREKDLAKLARQGFAYETARRIIDREDGDVA